MENTTSEKWKGVTGGGNLGQKSLVFLFKHCNIRVGYAIMYIVIPFYMIFGAKYRKAISHYFNYVYGYGFWKRLIKAWQTYNNFGKVILDRFAIFAGQKNKFKVECDGVENFDQLVKQESGFMMVGSHTGNFEICGYLLSQNIKKIYALVFGGESQSLQRRRFQQLSQNNVEMLPVTEDMTHLFTIKQALDNGNIVTMPADRALGSTKSITEKFGNATANFPIGPFSVAAVCNVPILSVFVFKVDTYKYKIIVKKIGENASENLSTKQRAELYTKEYVKILEQQVFAYPTQWFNFFEFFNQNG